MCLARCLGTAQFNGKNFSHCPNARKTTCLNKTKKNAQAMNIRLFTTMWNEKYPCGERNEPSITNAKAGLHLKKLILPIWWHCVLRAPIYKNKTLNLDKYCCHSYSLKQQLMKSIQYCIRATPGNYVSSQTRQKFVQFSTSRTAYELPSSNPHLFLRSLKKIS